MKKKILVDMSATLIHHGHIRLLKKASKYGDVIIGLSSDKDIKKYKGYSPELSYKFRKEILLSIKYVKKVVCTNYHVTEKDILKNKIDLLIHGNDFSNHLTKTKFIKFKRTSGISSTKLRAKACNILTNKFS